MSPDLGRTERMARMYRRGVPIFVIAEEFGIATKNVRANLIRCGVYQPKRAN